MDALEIAWQFAAQYYTFMMKSPDQLHCFYKEDSQCTLAAMEGEASATVEGVVDIYEHYKRFKGNDIRLTNIDAQSCRDGILVFVCGDWNDRKFMQTLYLAPQPSGYYVLNDVFRFAAADPSVFDDDEDLSLAEEKTPTQESTRRSKSLSPIQESVDEHLFQSSISDTAAVQSPVDSQVLIKADDVSEQVKSPEVKSPEVRPAEVKSVWGKPVQEHTGDVKQFEVKKAEVKSQKQQQVKVEKPDAKKQEVKAVKKPEAEKKSDTKKEKKKVEKLSANDISTVYIDGLPSDVDLHELRSTIQSAEFKVRRMQRMDNGQVFVKFDSFEAARRAVGVALYMKNDTIKIKMQQQKQAKPLRSSQTANQKPKVNL